MASHFGVRGFPTIMYIDSERNIEFLGDRNKDEMLEFVKRLSGPSIRKLSGCDDLEKVKRQHGVFFINFADEPTSNYSAIADQFHSTDWFYFLDKQCPNYEFNSIYCVKTSLRNSAILKQFDSSTQSLADWIRLERFPKFIRIGLTNLHYLMSTDKLLAIVLIKESKVGRFTTNKEREYYEILEQQANAYPHNDQFIFGWTNQLDMINSIAIRTIDPIPTYIFINASTMNYYLYEDDANDKLNNEQQLIKVLDSFVNKEPILIVQGGNDHWSKLKRLGYDGFSTVSLMFESNPILTVILFGLPITFFSIIIYCSCCSDMLDGDGKMDFDEEDEEFSGGEENYELNENNEINDNESIDEEEVDEEEIDEGEIDEAEIEYGSNDKTDHLKSD